MGLQGGTTGIGMRGFPGDERKGEKVEFEDRDELLLLLLPGFGGNGGRGDLTSPGTWYTCRLAAPRAMPLLVPLISLFS